MIVMTTVVSYPFQTIETYKQEMLPVTGSQAQKHAYSYHTPREMRANIPHYLFVSSLLPGGGGRTNQSTNQNPTC